MARTQPSLIVLAALFTAWSTGSSAAQVLVVPDRSKCEQEGNGTCVTLTELQNQTFSESGTTWVFSAGTHVARSAVTAFVNASNIALQCGESGQEKDCVISCPPDCVFTFLNCTNVTVQHLSVTIRDADDSRSPVKCFRKLHFSNSSHFYCPSTRAWVLERVENAKIRGLHFRRSGQLALLAPRGKVEVEGCSFTGFKPTATILESHSMTSPVAVHVMGPPPYRGALTVNICNCSFERIHYFPEKRDGKQFSQHAIKVTVHKTVDTSSTLALTVANCDFLRSPAVDVNVTDKQRTTVKISNCTLKGEANCSHGNCQDFHQLQASGVRVTVTTGWATCNVSSPQPRVHVSISGNEFTHLASYEGTGVLVQLFSASNCRGDPCCQHAAVVMHNNSFHHNWGLWYGSMVHAKHTSSGRSCLTFSTTRPALLLDGNVINSNLAELARCQEYEILDYSTGHSFYISQQKRLQGCEPNDHGQGAVYLEGFQGVHFASYHNNSVYNNTARGVFLDSTQLTIWGPNHIVNNSASFGGGLYLHHQSQLLFTENSSLNISGNRATFSGGGIYVSDDCYKPDHYANSTCRCFFELLTETSNTLSTFSPRVFASGNTAHTSGNVVYVSTMGQCNQSAPHSNMDSLSMFQNLFSPPIELKMKQVASFPQQVCLCNNLVPDCSLSAMNTVQVYPGQNLSLRVLVRGDLNITLQTQIAVHAAKNEPYTSLREFPPLVHSQILQAGCNSMLLPLHSAQPQPGNYTLLFVVPHHPDVLTRSRNSFLIANLSVQLLHDCPPGFYLSNHTTCVCRESLESVGIDCSLGAASVSNVMESVSFTIPYNYWLGQDGGQLYYSTRCTPLFCNNSEQHNEVQLFGDSHQCLHNREGLLCGNCPKGESAVLGSPKCKECSNYYLLLLLVDAALGPLLIGVLCFLNLTVSTRSINGLLFYISVVSINIDLFPVFSNNFPNYIVSALNLDGGFNMCLYDRMTIKDRTAISFAFPLYLLVLVAVLMAASRCIPMHKVNKLIGPRITPVLATVIFLSYTRLFNAVLKSLLFTHVCDGNTGKPKLVWQFDGKLSYFSTDHLVLAVIALVTLCGLLLPITVIAVAGDLFRRCIRNRWYMNFLDTFHGSFRFRLGFWIGLRLVVRMLLLTLKVSTVPPEIVQLVTVCIVLTLAVVQSVLKPFRHLRLDRFTHPRLERWCTEEAGRTIANTLDISFLVNLLALFVCLSYAPNHGEVFLTLSLVVVLLQLLVILLYHLLEYSPLGPPILQCYDRTANWFKKRFEEKEEEGSFLTENDMATRVSQLPLVLDPNECTDESYESSLGSPLASTEQEDVGLVDKTT